EVHEPIRRRRTREAHAPWELVQVWLELLEPLGVVCLHLRKLVEDEHVHPLLEKLPERATFYEPGNPVVVDDVDVVLFLDELVLVLPVEDDAGEVREVLPALNLRRPHARSEEHTSELQSR